MYFKNEKRRQAFEAGIKKANKKDKETLCLIYLLSADPVYADLSPVIGSEQGGVRPVLVIQNDTGNKYSPTTIVAAITSRQNKAKLPTHIEITEDVFEKDSIVLLEQIRTVDKRRLKEYVGKLDNGTMDRVNKAISISVGLIDNVGENKNDSRTG